MDSGQAGIFQSIVNRLRELVMNPSKHQSSKQRGQDLDWKVHNRAHLLFLTHILCMNYVIALFLLVSCMKTCNLFCATVNYQNSEQKPTTKNFAGLYNHFPLLTMFSLTIFAQGQR